MELIFQGKFKGFTGIEHTVNIYDKDDASIIPEVQELILQAPGYTISYSTDISNIVKTGIIKSEIKLIIQNPDGILNDFLNDLGIYENKFLVEVLQDDVPYWRGIILSDFGNIGDGKYNAVQLSGTDGTGLLADEDVLKIDPNNKSSLGRYIIEGLAKLPTADFFTTDSFLKIKTDWRSILMNDSIIRDPLMMVSAGDYATDKFMWQTYSKRIGYNGAEVVEIKYMDYQTVISHILTRFNAVLFMYKGAWCILQRDLLELSTSIDLFQYDKTGEMLMTGLPKTPDYYTLVSNVEINQSDNYRAQGSFDFLPGLKSVEVSYLGNLSNGESNPSLMSFSWAPASVPNGRDADYWYLVGHSSQGGIGTWTSPKLYTGSGNYIATNIKWRDVYEIHQTGTWNMTAFTFVEIKLVGTSNTYYLRRYPNATTGVIEHKWTLTPVKIMLPPCDGVPLGITQQITTFTSGTGQSTAPVYNESLAFSLDIPNSQDIPEDGNVTITIERGDLISTTSIYNPLGFTPAPAFEPEWINTGYTNFNFPNEDWLSYFFYFIINNEAPSESIYFKVNNDVDGFSLVNTLEDSLLGSAGSSTTGLLEVWNGTAWISPFTTANKYWAKGDVSIYGLYFNQLLIDEVLANQIHPLLCFNGLLINRTNIPIHPVQSISILYNGSSYRLHLRNVTYNPYAEEWSGDWFEISRVKRMTVAPGDPIALPMPLINNQAGANSATQIIATALSRLDILQVTNTAITVDDHILNIDGVGLQTKPHPAIIPNIGILQQAVGHRIIQTDTAGTRTPIDGHDLVIYGYLYNYYALANIANTTDGWRVPTTVDFSDLLNYAVSLFGGDWTTIGLYLRSIRQDGTSVVGGDTQIHPRWDCDSVNEGVDSLLFSAVPGGRRLSGNFIDLGSYCGYLSSSVLTGQVRILRLEAASAQITSQQYVVGSSVRLVRDASSTEIGLADGTAVDPYIGNDGKTYISIKIGDQIWTAENLAETKYNDGSLIPRVTDGTTWNALATGARCAYNNDRELAIYLAGMKEVQSDPDIFDGIGTADAPLALLNAGDNIVYGILNGKLTPVTDRRYAGVYTKPTFTDNGDGTITIGTGVYNLYHTTDNSGHIYQYTIAGDDLSPTDKTIMYIYADYNAGTPQIALTNNPEDINQSSKQIIFTIYRDGTTVQRIEWDEPSKGLSDKIHNRLIKTERFKKEFTGGLVLSETTGNIVNISSGNIWYGAVRKTLAAFVSNADVLIQYFHSSGVWTEGYRSTYNNLEYDDGTDLVELTNNKYTVNWVYRLVGDDAVERAAIVLGNTQYNNPGDATAAELPTIPDVVLKIGILVGRIIVQKSAASGTVEKLQDFTFVGGASASTPPGGNDTEVQFNDAATFAGDSTFTFNKTSKEVGAQTVSITRDIKLTNTTNASKYGVIQKNGKRFIHDFNYGNNGSVTTEGKNIFIGEEAGNLTMGATATSASEASYNIGIGYRPLYSNTIGAHNIALGYNSLGTATTASYNVVIGYNSMRFGNADGNIAIGQSALYGTTGGNNVAVGKNTLFSNVAGANNVAIGEGAAYSNIAGNGIVCIGRYSLFNATGGTQCTAVGYYAMYSNVAGTDGTAIGTNSQYYCNNTTTPWNNTNVSIGYSSLRGSTTAANNTGIDNVAIGYQSMYNNTSGSQNHALGINTLVSNTTGSANIAIGYVSLYSNTTGGNNTGIGHSALYKNATGTGNYALGHTAMYTNVAGSYGVAIGYESQAYCNDSAIPWTNSNVSIGYNALRGSTTAANNTGNHNVAIGYNSMLNTSTGENNMAIGSQTMAANTTGSKNVALGFYSLFANTTGQQNIAIGHQALSNNQVHSSNVAIGTQALYNTVQSANVGIGVEALYANTSGYYNIAIGQAAGRFITGGSNPNQTGTYSLFIGAETKAKANGETNQIVIGYNATGLGSNTVVLGNSSITITRLQGSVGIGTDAPAAKLQVIGDCRFGGATDYTEFEPDGTRHAVGAATTYRDELNNLVGQKLESPSSDIVTNYTECTLDFKTSAKYNVDFAFMNIQINHDWLIGTPIFPHLHWIQEEENTPNWIISYRWQINGETKQTAWTPLIWNSNTFSWVSGSLNQITSFPNIEPPEGAGLSDILQIKLHRDTDNDSLGFGDIDNYTLTAQAYSFDIHIICDTDGSRTEYTK